MADDEAKRLTEKWYKQHLDGGDVTNFFNDVISHEDVEMWSTAVVNEGDEREIMDVVCWVLVRNLGKTQEEDWVQLLQDDEARDEPRYGLAYHRRQDAFFIGMTSHFPPEGGAVAYWKPFRDELVQRLNDQIEEHKAKK